MAASNSNATILKWDGVEFQGQWTEEIGFDESAAMVSMNSGANATYEKRNAGLFDTKFTFLIFYGTTDTERILAFNQLVKGQKGTLYYAPLGAEVGQQYWEGPVIVESRKGPNPKQDKSGQLMATITINGDGTPTHLLEDAVIA